MNCSPESLLMTSIVYVSATPSLKFFDRPLLKCLSRHAMVFQWESNHLADESTSLDQTVNLLISYLQEQTDPVHLVGHGSGGAIAHLASQRYAQKVRSLVLLALGAQIATTWHTHYYVHRQMFPHSREQILARLSHSLLGSHCKLQIPDLVRALMQDLDYSPMPHSLLKVVPLPQQGSPVPMLACGSTNDPIVDLTALQSWIHFFKVGDQLWQCPDGRHFFHFFHPQIVSEKMFNFWSSLPYERKGGFGSSFDEMSTQVRR